MCRKRPNYLYIVPVLPTIYRKRDFTNLKFAVHNWRRSVTAVLCNAQNLSWLREAVTLKCSRFRPCSHPGAQVKRSPYSSALDDDRRCLYKNVSKAIDFLCDYAYNSDAERHEYEGIHLPTAKRIPQELLSPGGFYHFYGWAIPSGLLPYSPSSHLQMKYATTLAKTEREKEMRVFTLPHLPRSEVSAACLLYKLQQYMTSYHLK